MKGRRYPLGLQTFKNVIEGNYVYVDKTDLVYELVHANKYCFLSRPRRFGKSLLVTTLKAYFEGKKELFKGLAMDGLETEWTAYPVIHLDLSCGKYNSMESLTETLNKVLSPYEALYHLAPGNVEAFNVRLINIIEAAKRKTGKNVVVLIDAFDAPMHDSMKNEDLQDMIRDVMCNFFCPLKSEEANLQFVFLTGISKFCQLSIFCELNNITDISMWDKYCCICGISKEELLEYFHDDFEELASANDMSYEEALAELECNYDGYHFSGKGAGVYNPYSLFNCLKTLEFDNYWFFTDTPTLLIELLQKKNIDMLQLGDIWTTSDRFDTPTEKITDTIPVLYQSGYLTIKDYNSLAKLYKLGFPNEEVRKGFSNILLSLHPTEG